MAGTPGGVFDGLVVGATLLIVLSWCYLYAQAHGRTMRIPGWMNTLRVRLYVLFINRLYVDEIYHKLGQVVMRTARRVDADSIGRFL